MARSVDLSKESECPFVENRECEHQAKYMKNYAAYLSRLAESGSSDIFTNGGHDDMACSPDCEIWRMHKLLEARNGK